MTENPLRTSTAHCLELLNARKDVELYTQRVAKAQQKIETLARQETQRLEILRTVISVYPEITPFLERNPQMPRRFDPKGWDARVVIQIPQLLPIFIDLRKTEESWKIQGPDMPHGAADLPYVIIDRNNGAEQRFKTLPKAMEEAGSEYALQHERYCQEAPKRAGGHQ